MTFYVAYGRNMNVAVMRERCPQAIKVCAWRIDKARLVFRDVADITADPKGSVPAGMWWVTPECERFLDRFEGPGYRKLYWPERTIHGRTGEIYTYQMVADRGVRPPEQEYYDAIVRGYKDFGFGRKDLRMLRDAAEWAEGNKQITAHLHERYIRRGRKSRVKLEEVQP